MVERSGIKGGLVVHVGCGDGALTSTMRINDSFLVHGLDADQDNIDKARARIKALGLYGQISVNTFYGDHLPYTDNLVNLIIADDLGSISEEEVMRVLAPGGVAYIGSPKRRVVKAWPSNIDEWTHYMHNPANNMVADDQVGPPRHIQWKVGP
jgi:ubiquinone/menaquinone biosynthesis C-methylase UbiE